MAETRCIICGKRTTGLKVKSDIVINTIRWFKTNITKNEKGYNLVVCKEDYPKYAKERKRFQRKQTFYLVIGFLFLAVLVISAKNELIAVVYGMIVVIFMYALALLSYTPAVEMKPQKG